MTDSAKCGTSSTRGSLTEMFTPHAPVMFSVPLAISIRLRLIESAGHNTVSSLLRCVFSCGGLWTLREGLLN